MMSTQHYSPACKHSTLEQVLFALDTGQGKLPFDIWSFQKPFRSDCWFYNASFFRFIAENTGNILSPELLNEVTASQIHYLRAEGNIKTEKYNTFKCNFQSDMRFKYRRKSMSVLEPSSNSENGTKFAEFILSNTSAAAEDNTAESACTELQCCSAAVHRGSISCQSGIREILKLKSKCFCGTKFPPPSSCSSANFVRALIDRSKM